jgi:uncharacterized membrane protein
MTTSARLWAIGYDDMERADQALEVITELGWGPRQVGRSLNLEDVAVVIRHTDGSFAIDRKPFPGVANILACAGAGFLAGLVLAAPLTGASIGALLGSAGSAAAATHAVVSEDFIRDVEALMKPGASALFVLDHDGDMQVILHAIQGLGGTVLKTNVDAERARLIQCALSKSTYRSEEQSK